MAPARNSKARGSNGLFWDLLTFDRLVTGPVIHLIYWAGLGVVALFAFSVVGAAVGLALKEPGLQSLLLAFPVMVAGLLVAVAMVLLWRAFCEFYVAIFRISEDLRALRQASDADHAVAAVTRPPAQKPLG
jgi:Na+/H+ antiporter NhaC